MRTAAAGVRSVWFNVDAKPNSVITFVPGDLYSKVMQLSAAGKTYVGGNRESRWGPGLIVSDV
jgi:hypothetical protein